MSAPNMRTDQLREAVEKLTEQQRRLIEQAARSAGVPDATIDAALGGSRPALVEVRQALRAELPWWRRLIIRR